MIDARTDMYVQQGLSYELASGLVELQRHLESLVRGSNGKFTAEISPVVVELHTESEHFTETEWVLTGVEMSVQFVEFEQAVKDIDGV